MHRNVQRMFHAKFPPNTGIGDVISKDVKIWWYIDTSSRVVVTPTIYPIFAKSRRSVNRRRRNVRRNIRAKFPARAGIGDAILTDVKIWWYIDTSSRVVVTPAVYPIFAKSRRSIPRRTESDPAAIAGVGTSVRSFHGVPATAMRFRPIWETSVLGAIDQHASPGRGRGLAAEPRPVVEVGSRRKKISSRRGRLRPIAGAGACTRTQAAVSCRRLRRAGSLLRNPVPEKRLCPECDSHSEELPPPFRVGPCRHRRRRNVRRNVRAKFPSRAGIGDAISTDLKNVGPRGYRPARAARARAGSCRRGRFEENKFSSRYRDAVACVP